MKSHALFLALLLSLFCSKSEASVTAEQAVETASALLPPESGCQISDLEIQALDLIRIRNLSPATCKLSSGELVSIGLSFGHQFYSGVAAQWAHRGESGKILFHVNAELATSRMLNDVYANSSKLSFDLHIGKSGFFAGPMIQSVLLVNPLISSPQTLRFSGAGGEIGYQRPLGNHFKGEVTIGMSVLGPDRDVGVLEGRVGLSYLIFGDQKPRGAIRR
jgi:hypothetical protein